MAEEALDTPELLGRSMAKKLYDFLYDPLSAASHGDLRFARLVLLGGDAAFVSSAFVYAAGATEFLLLCNRGSPQLLRDALHGSAPFQPSRREAHSGYSARARGLTAFRLRHGRDSNPRNPCINVSKGTR